MRPPVRTAFVAIENRSRAQRQAVGSASGEVGAEVRWWLVGCRCAASMGATALGGAAYAVVRQVARRRQSRGAESCDAATSVAGPRSVIWDRA